MDNILEVIDISVSVLLVNSILIQAKLGSNVQWTLDPNDQVSWLKVESVFLFDKTPEMRNNIQIRRS